MQQSSRYDDCRSRIGPGLKAQDRIQMQSKPLSFCIGEGERLQIELTAFALALLDYSNKPLTTSFNDFNTRSVTAATPLEVVKGFVLRVRQSRLLVVPGPLDCRRGEISSFNFDGFSAINLQVSHVASNADTEPARCSPSSKCQLSS